MNAAGVGGAALGKIRPLLQLSERLGRLGQALLPSGLSALELRYTGSRAEAARPLLLSALQGAMNNVLDRRAINLVNAQHVAAERGVATAVVDRRAFTDREAFADAIEANLQAARVEIVCLAGFMRLLAPRFVERWRGRMINIHPSLLPAFKGLNTHARALAAGVTRHGCTVHFVEPELDSGATILQAEVPVLPDDDEKTLAARVLKEEHRIYPEALMRVALALEQP